MPINCDVWRAEYDTATVEDQKRWLRLVMSAKLSNSRVKLSLISASFSLNDNRPNPNDGISVAIMAKMKILLLILLNVVIPPNQGCI
jgi:hypothetical protein